MNWHGSQTGFAAYHNSRVNILFADGHVGTLGGAEVGQTLGKYARNDYFALVIDRNWVGTRYPLQQ
ncbi:MAG: hypothetical protein MR051_09360 [Lentisphaeria bacterium]|nr:hypothetical protein [Lentisphaeria bacterium]